MKCIIQHNFNTGWGDAWFAMTDYLNNAINLKEKGFNLELRFNLNRNLYFKTKKPLDYLDRKIFEIFDKITYDSEVLHTGNLGNLCCVYTFASAKPSEHYFDIFVESENKKYFEDNIEVLHFNMYKLVNKIHPRVYPVINEEIQNLYETFVNQNKLNSYDSIYWRTQDLQEELSFLEKNKNSIKEIVNQSNQLFICSNSVEFKKFVKSLNSSNIYFWEIPLENELGGNHLNHQELNDNDLHQRTIYTFLDAWTMGHSKTVHFFTTWNRYSNFLFYAPLNESKIIYYQ
jgi:hypothetical protein